jgi:hypothetical protein
LSTTICAASKGIKGSQFDIKHHVLELILHTACHAVQLGPFWHKNTVMQEIQQPVMAVYPT